MAEYRTFDVLKRDLLRNTSISSRAISRWALAHGSNRRKRYRLCRDITKVGWNHLASSVGPPSETSRNACEPAQRSAVCLTLLNGRKVGLQTHRTERAALQASRQFWWDRFQGRRLWLGELLAPWALGPKKTFRESASYESTTDNTLDSHPEFLPTYAPPRCRETTSCHASKKAIALMSICVQLADR